jgi:hypothetical protein
MKAKGFVYTPVKYLDDSVIFSALNPLNQAAVPYGYHGPPEPEPNVPSQGSEGPEFFDALSTPEGCANRARSFVYDAPGAGRVSLLLDELTRAVDQAIVGYAATAEGQRRLTEWSSCMLAKGYDYASPDDAAAELSTSEKISDKEIQVRRADYRCDLDVKLTESRSKFESAAFDGWQDTHAEAVRQLSALEGEAILEVTALTSRLTDEGVAALARGRDARETTDSTLPPP